MRWLNWFISAFTGKEPVVARLTDPLFGALTRGERPIWDGTVTLPQIGPVAIHIHGKRDGPTDWQRNVFREMIERFPALRIAMEQPLTTEYDRARQAGEEFELLLEASGIWSVCSLCAIEINGEDAGITFSFNHEVKGGNEHGLNVRIKDWRVIEVAVE